MNGAQALIRTLVDSGVDTCFMNPGTSEMHFVAALDAVPEMRGVLGLFEGVATGAADGYARMAGRPAASCCTSARVSATASPTCTTPARAHTPIVNIVGDHATYHKQYDAPARVRHRDRRAQRVARGSAGRRADRRWQRDAAEAVAAAIGPARTGRHADPARRRRRGPTAASRPRPRRRAPSPPSTATPSTTSPRSLRSGEPAALFLGGVAPARAGAGRASRVADATGAKLLAETFPTRLERGAGLPPVERLGVPRRVRRDAARGPRHLILVDAKAPVSFFAYPDKASYLVPDGCEVHVLANGADDAVAALEALADALGAPRRRGDRQRAPRPERPTGALTAETDRRGDRRAAARGRDRVRRGQHVGAVRTPAATAGAPRARLALPHRRRHRPGPAGGHRRRRRLLPTDGSSPSRPTAARCTRSSRCGPRPARASTSRRSSSTTGPTRCSTWS